MGYDPPFGFFCGISVLLTPTSVWICSSSGSALKCSFFVLSAAAAAAAVSVVCVPLSTLRRGNAFHFVQFHLNKRVVPQYLSTGKRH